VLKVPATGLKPVQFAPAAVRRGQWTIALGNPYGLAGAGEMAMSVGVVSATERSLPKLSTKENRSYTNLIQTTAEINPGNSGGPLFDVAGNVIGINAAVVLPQKQTNGIGFALPVTPKLIEEIRSLKEGREIVYGYLGVTVSTPTSADRRSAGINSDVGVSIDSVDAGSPASTALRAHDIVVSIGGKPVSDSDAFVAVIGGLPVDRATKIDVYRGGKPIALDVTVRRRPMPTVAVTSERQRFRWRGMLLGPIPANWDFGKAKRPANGLMVYAVSDSSAMTKRGICMGSIITAFAGKPVSAISELQSILNQTPAEQCSIELSTGPVGVMVGNAAAATDAR